MNLLLMILVAVVVAFLLAYLVVKFVPLKMRWLVSLLLLGASIYLGYKIYEGIMRPINFNINKKVRYAKVINNLRSIRDAEVKYHEVYGKYAQNKDTLVNFIEHGKLAITESKNIMVRENRGGGIYVNVSKRKVDTTGYEPVSKYFKDVDYKNMFKVPGTDKEFVIETGTVEKVQGLEVPVFIVRTDKESVLKGMDPGLIKQELEAITTDEIKGSDISVGSLSEVSTSGNWPPFYDKPKTKNKVDKKE
ncbi:hypothetical protein [Tenacibaculum sp. UWU-22]|uniref:hypothetical protein n=1 Tax=Tenacibaculum sp. UWU-22 TaxID=3234187 RepID=UPI0034DAC47A